MVTLCGPTDNAVIADDRNAIEIGAGVFAAPHDPDLELRGKLIRSLGLLRQMLPGSFVERQRACGQLTCHCADRSPPPHQLR